MELYTSVHAAIGACLLWSSRPNTASNTKTATVTQTVKARRGAARRGAAVTPGRVHVYEEWTSSETLEAHLQSHWYRDMGAHLRQYPRKPPTRVIKKYRVDLEEPVYDSEGVARGHFFTES